MASAAPLAAADRVSTGRVLERAFGTIRHNPVVTIGLTFLVGVVPTLAGSAGILLPLRYVSDRPDLFVGFFGFMVLFYVAWMAILAITQAVLTKPVVAEAEGRKAGFGESLRGGISMLLPLTGLALVFGFAVIIGFYLFVIPGVFLYIIWCVSAPAMVEERLGVFAALSRSATLTKGERWKIFGILLILALTYFAVTLAFALFGVSTIRSSLLTGTAVGLGWLLAGATINLVVETIWATTLASLYVELRDAKDGPATDQLEEVFG